MTTALFRPQIHHLSDEVERIAGGNAEKEGKVEIPELDPVVAELLVHEEECSFVLEPSVDGEEVGEEEELVGGQREATLEQVGRAFFDWDAPQGIEGRGVASSQLEGPLTVCVVGSAGILEGDSGPAHRERGHGCGEEVLEGVVVCVFGWRVGASVNVLEHGQLDSNISSCLYHTE